MFLLVLAHPGFPGQIPQSRKTVVCVCVLEMLQHRHGRLTGNCDLLNGTNINDLELL